MKHTIKKWLKKYPFIFKLIHRIYRILFPIQQLATELEKQELTKVLEEQMSKNLKYKKNIFFIQVGSNDGLHGDPLHNLITTNKEWRGIFIEPVKYLFERLKNNYGSSEKYIFENKAIGSNSRIVEFFYVSESAKSDLGDDLPDWYNQLGSFDKNHILKHLNGILEPYIISDKIETVSLQNILDKYKIKAIDILHIDTEGSDYEVLSSFDLSICKPSVILYEHMHLSCIKKKLSEVYLKRNGYSCIHYGGDTLAILKGQL